jgi:probable HAF family extracellular repeat protein
MKTIPEINLRSFLLAAAFVVGLGGVAHASAQPNRAYLIDLNSGAATDLGMLGGDFSYAYGINHVGQVVGYSHTPDNSRHAFITGPNGVGMRDLGTRKCRKSWGGSS